jgi:hypothetical protein
MAGFSSQGTTLPDRRSEHVAGQNHRRADHVLPGLDAQAAETVARLILGDGPASTDVSKA